VVDFMSCSARWPFSTAIPPKEKKEEEKIEKGPKKKKEKPVLPLHLFVRVVDSF